MILVTGGAGHMGARLVERLRGRGFAVRVLVLPGDPQTARLDGVDCEQHIGDITDPRTLAAAFAGVHTVYHLAAVILAGDPRVFRRVNVEGTRNVLAAARDAGVEHLVYVSSASVVYPRPTPYSLSKRAAERLVRRYERPAWTIVRPTLVYERDGGQEFALFKSYLKRFPVVPFIGDGRARKSPVLAEDLIAGLAELAGNRKAYGKTYNLCGGDEITIGELARLILETEGLRRRFVHLPAAACELVAAALGMVLADPPLTWPAVAGVTQDANLDRSLARRDLGYAPVGVHEGFKRCFGEQGGI